MITFNRIAMEALKAIWEALWKTCASITVITSGLYIYSRILMTLDEQVHILFGITYAITIVGSVIWIWLRGIKFGRKEETEGE